MADLAAALVDSWEVGRAYERELLADVLDDIVHAFRPLPRRSHEERVADRIAAMEECAERIPEDHRRQRQRDTEHDAAVIAIGLRYPPLTWPVIREWVDANTWARIRAGYWDAIARRWLPGTPQAVMQP